MKPAILLCAFLVATPTTGPTAHLRYQRTLQLPQDANGETCAILDPQVFAHMASRAGDDLRVYDEAANEVPFDLTESGAEPGDAQPATVQHIAVHNDIVDFDLAMPHRPYTAVELQIAANNFTAQATVTGSDGLGGRPTPLGSFTLFDLTREHLARSTELPLQESTFALLHVTLRVFGIAPTTATIAGATVPPSREAQTLYTEVASTHELLLQEKGWGTVANFDLPEHVPVEGVRIALDPAWPGDFLRSVRVEGEARNGTHEGVDGELWRVTRAASADGSPSIQASKLATESVLAINLRSAAKITVALKNGADRPLPMRSIALEMRQRTLCFSAIPGERYTLRYGDTALHAPVYNHVAIIDPSVTPTAATLGTETVNPNYAARPIALHLSDDRSQMFWIGLLALVTLGGSLALHRVRNAGKKG